MRALAITMAGIAAWGKVGTALGQDCAPVGPGGWTARNWEGFFLQIGLFLLGAVVVFWVSGAFSRDGGKGEGRGE